MEPFPTTGVTFAGDDETFFAAAPLPTVGAGRITGNTPSYTGADDQRLVFLVSIPADVTWGSDQTLVRVYTSGSIARWEITKTSADNKIGRAQCRERVCQYAQISVAAVPLQQNNKKQYHILTTDQ